MTCPRYCCCDESYGVGGMSTEYRHTRYYSRGSMSRPGHAPLTPLDRGCVPEEQTFLLGRFMEGEELSSLLVSEEVRLVLRPLAGGKAPRGKQKQIDLFHTMVPLQGGEGTFTVIRKGKRSLFVHADDEGRCSGSIC